MNPIEVKKIVFIHDDGDGGYAADEALVISLKTTLGKDTVYFRSASLHLPDAFTDTFFLNVQHRNF